MPTNPLQTGPALDGSTSRQAQVADANDSEAGDDDWDDEEEDEVLQSDPLASRSAQSSSTHGKMPSALRIPSSKSTPSADPDQLTPENPAATSIRRRRTPVHGEAFNDADEFDGPVSNLNTYLNGSAFGQNSKLPGTIDWYAEGPGRRVAYDDLTAIDWIFEYAKERQRLRVLHATATGFFGYLRRIADASQTWIILVFTGIATGVVAASIDIVSDWLGDLKSGYCKNGRGGGRFYLNKAFCCWGHDEFTDCRDWAFWSGALGVSSRSGGFLVEYTFFVVFSVLFAAVASFFVKRFAIYAKHSGIPEIKTVLGGFVIRRFLSTWTLVIKSLGLCLAVASGLWLGKEGPLVHVACCCANFFLKVFGNLGDNEARKREILSAAAAAGISVAFGAPVGGVLFSLEQLSYYFPDKTMWQSFVCAMIAAVTLQAFNPFRTGKLVLYQVTYSTGWHAFELLPFALLGILGGLYGGLFIKVNMKINSWRRSSRMLPGPFFQVLIVAMATALINFPNRFMRAQTSELVATLFSECSELPDERLGLCGRAPVPVVISNLSSAAILGFLLASVTFGLLIPAGIILPSMAIGSLYGRAIGLLMRTWVTRHPDWLIFSACEPDAPCVTAGTYAIIGAATALAGATRMTVSIVVIMFELTGALTYVLPIMIAVMISKWVGDAFGHRGIYESWIHFNGYPFLDNRDEAQIPDAATSDIMTRTEDLVVIPATGHTIGSLERLLKTHQYRGFPVISEPRNALLLGYISRTELAYALESALGPPRNLSATSEAFFTHQPLADPSAILDLRPWMDQTPITLSARSSLQLAATLFLKLGLRYVLFTERGLLKGLLTKKDVWYVLNGVEEEGRRGNGNGNGNAVPRQESQVDI